MDSENKLDKRAIKRLCKKYSLNQPCDNQIRDLYLAVGASNQELFNKTVNALKSANEQADPKQGSPTFLNCLVEIPNLNSTRSISDEVSPQAATNYFGYVESLMWLEIADKLSASRIDMTTVSFPPEPQCVKCMTGLGEGNATNKTALSVLDNGTLATVHIPRVGHPSAERLQGTLAVKGDSGDEIASPSQSVAVDSLGTGVSLTFESPSVWSKEKPNALTLSWIDQDGKSSSPWTFNNLYYAKAAGKQNGGDQAGGKFSLSLVGTNAISLAAHDKSGFFKMKISGWQACATNEVSVKVDAHVREVSADGGEVLGIPSKENTMRVLGNGTVKVTLEGLLSDQKVNVSARDAQATTLFRRKNCS